MTSKSKIKIVDNTDLRDEIEKNTELISHVDLAKWSISVAKHILHFLEEEFPNNENIKNGFKVNELWQKGEATVHKVRQAGFKVHEIARKCKSETAKASARAVGQAVGVGNMRGHAMVATDYAIKSVGLKYNENIDKITDEREWQLHELKKYIK
ncbi:MAG TPA: hypothetical protein K8V35_09425 [Aliicoccus persicus]|uniref:Imm-5-like domain-containing protein n=1 Tax=Aliicoccus persicus TaxID=930138 RepID=A0A921DYH5_9STAP|nr:hypothetical protein [Aliicoccus persicus]